MKINETIRKYRKQQNLTQEQVANYLGVTAPAVNKWENGNSYPDITLLAPLARILHTNVDTLLSFKEDLTEAEMRLILNDIILKVNTESYEAAFETACTKVKEYPDCDKLILSAAQLLQAYLMMKKDEVAEQEKYQKQIKAWYESVAFGDDKELANKAILALSQNYMIQEDYEEAQKLLDQIPPMGFDKRTMQAVLYSRQGQTEKAYEIEEKMIFQYGSSVVSCLVQIASILTEEEQFEKALEYTELLTDIAKLLDLGTYVGSSIRLEIYVKMKDVDRSLQALEELVETGVDVRKCVKQSELYQHMDVKNDEGVREMEAIVKKGIRDDKEFDFLRENPRFQALLAKL